MSHYRNGKNGGHVGGHVRNTFLAAVDAYLAWEEGEPEPTIDYAAAARAMLAAIKDQVAQ